MKIHDLVTPALLVDADALEANLADMAAALPGPRMRPHVKAHKSTELARRQLAVTPHFVAYAIDWELEGDQLATILRDCGASADALREFQSRKWI